MELRTNTSLAAIGDMIRTHQRIGIAAHVRPDGDALGSVLALGLSLREMGKDVILLSEDGCPSALSFLPDSLLIQRPSGPLAVDMVFALDTATQERLGAGVNEAFAACEVMVNLDHHVSNPDYGTWHYIDTKAPATGQIIAQLLRENNFPINRGIAEALYTAISTDTGSFQFPKTTAETHRYIADLIETGIDVGQLNTVIYQSYPLRRVRLLSEMLAVMDISSQNRVASGYLTQEMIQRCEATTDDTENLIDHLRSIDSVQVAAYLEEMSDGKVRLSVRSKDARIDVSAICAQFGGGGHVLAAGARLAGPILAAREKVLSAIHEAISHI
jgi:bifunctional oligoribonuclease and PAP phosphatase NrnA